MSFQRFNRIFIRFLTSNVWYNRTISLQHLQFQLSSSFKPVRFLSLGGHNRIIHVTSISYPCSLRTLHTVLNNLCCSSISTLFEVSNQYILHESKRLTHFSIEFYYYFYYIFPFIKEQTKCLLS